MKVAVIVLLVALCLPAITHAFLFGVTITSTTGAVLAAATANQVGVIVLVGVAGAALAAAAGAAISTASTRHKRGIVLKNENDINEVLNVIFSDLEEQKIEGCFQRLVCDISATPESFKKNVPIVDAVLISEHHNLTPKARAVSAKLMEAVILGKTARDNSLCEQVYNHCEFSGTQMDLVIAGFEARPL